MSIVSDKTEWPTEEKLEELRSKGIVAYSKLSTACAGVLAICISLFVYRDNLPALLEDYLKGFKSSSDSIQFLADVFYSSLIFFVLPVLLVPIFSFVWGVFQTGFLVDFSLSAFLPERLWPVGRAERVQLSVSIFKFILGAMAACAVELIVLYLLFTPFSSVYALERGKLVGRVLETLFNALIVLLAVAALLMFFSWLLEKFLFRWRHRMSREELENRPR